MKYFFLVILLFLFAAIPIFTYAQVSFGGTVTTMRPCNTGFLITVAQPVGLPLNLMWFWGELPFMMHIPPHPGQQVLGMSAVTPAPCMWGYIPVGVGLPISFHGSSI